MQLVCLLVLLLSSFSSLAWEDHQLINGCKVFTTTGKNIRNFPGHMCIFLENGNLISASQTHLRLITPQNEIKWEIPGMFHHQLNISEDKKRILTLDSKLIDTAQGKKRADVVVVISVEDGKRLFENSSDKILSDSKIEYRDMPLLGDLKKRFGVEKEISHLNSVYEIPKISNKNVPDYIKEGNIVINGIHSGIAILSPDLKKILYKTTFPQSLNHWVHDVQVKENGNFIFFNNVNFISADKKPVGRRLQTSEISKNYSTIVEITPKDLKTVFEFGATPRGMFFSIICGSVQEYGDVIVFTHYLSGTYIYSKKKKDLLATVPGTHAEEIRVVPSQQVKAQDLRSFLQLWK